MYRRILVPLDGSEQSESVLPLVSTLAKASDAEVILLRVAEYPITLFTNCNEYPPRDPDLAKSILNKEQYICHETLDYLERNISTLQSAGVKAIKETCCQGPVVEAILASTDRLRIDLIILSTHGQSGSNQWVIGAVADRVLHEAKVPVILFRSDPGKEASSLFHKYYEQHGMMLMK